MPSRKQRSRGALPVILLAIFIDLVSNGVIAPIVPQLLANPSSTYYLLPHAVPVSYAYILLGLLISTFPVFMFFSTPVLGEYSDYVGRRKVMVMSLLGSALGLGIFATGIMMKSLLLLFVARIVGGIMSGNLAVAQAAIADITPPEKRAARFGLIGAAYGFGFIVGPVIGGLLSDSSLVSWFDASTPFWFSALLIVFDAILVYAFMQETRKSEEAVRIKWDQAIWNILDAFKMKKLRIVFLTNFLFQAGLTLFATFFAVFLTNTFGYDQVAVGYYIAYAGIWVIISQGFVLRYLVRFFDEITLLRVFLLAGALSVFLYYIPEHTIGLLIVGACFALTNGITMASLPSLASRLAPAHKQGEIMGLNTSVQALAQAIPPVIAGFLAAEITPSAPVYAAGAVIFLGWIVFVVGVKRA
jgi:DHA1 family tetracycline resistance protein-like MFS transporter